METPNPITIKVEGALLRVCHRCSAFGNPVNDPPPTTTTPSTVNTGRRDIRRTTSTPQRMRSKPIRSQEGEQELIPDYGEAIRKGRMSKKLTQEKLSSLTGISVPFIKSIEAENMRPTDIAVKKLERELGIELMGTLETELEYNKTTEKKGTTLGDIAVIKRFDYD